MPHSVHFLLSFLLIINRFTIILSADSSDQPSTRPIWTYPSPSGNECICGSALIDIIICNPDSLAVHLNVQFFCFMLFNDNGVSTALIGTCPYDNSQRLPRNLSVSEIYEDSRLCSFYNRKGQLCGECAENYTLPASSYHLGCVECKSYNNGWLKFIVAAFLPLTIFYMIVIIFRISARVYNRKRRESILLHILLCKHTADN